MEVAAQALDSPRDRFIDYALAQAVGALRPLWYPALTQGALQFAQKPEHLRFVLESEGTKEVAGLLRQLAGRPGLDAAFRERILALLAGVGSAEDLRYALDAAPRSEAVLQELAATAAVHRRKPSGDLLEPVRALIADPDSSLRARGIALAGAWGLTALAPAVRDELARADNAETVYAAALTASPALFGKDALRLLEPFATSQKPPRLQVAAVAAMASVDLPAAARTVAELFAGVENEADMNELLAPFLNRQGGAEALAQALQAKAPTAASARMARRVLNKAGRSDASLMAILHQAIGLENQELPYDPNFVKSLAREAMTHGDAGRGRTVFLSSLASCSACHKLDGQGGETGPDLTLIGAGRSPEQLIESLLWPNRQIREGYLATTITTRDGEQFTGYRIRETADEWQLRDPAANQIRRIAKADVQATKDPAASCRKGSRPA